MMMIYRGDTGGLDVQVLLLGIEVWLLWLQPWNALAILNSSAGKFTILQPMCFIKVSFFFFTLAACVRFFKMCVVRCTSVAHFDNYWLQGRVALLCCC